MELEALQTDGLNQVYRIGSKSLKLTVIVIETKFKENIFQH
jgi:hypothetical protein